MAFALAGVAASAGAAPASRTDACLIKVVGRANFDGDKARESLVLQKGCTGGRRIGGTSWSLQDAGWCTLSWRIGGVRSSTLEDPIIGRIAEADARRYRREAFTVLHGTGHTGASAAIVHLTRARPGGCPALRYLFRYRQPAGVEGFDAQLADLAAFPGLEVRLEERLADHRRVRLFRFSPKRGNYVAYADSSPAAG